MNPRFMLHIVAPTIAISLLLFGLGILAAWNVQQHQASVSALVNQEFHDTLAAQRLLLVVNDIRQLLRQFQTQGDKEFLDQINRLKPILEERLLNLDGSSRSNNSRSSGNPKSQASEKWVELNQGTQLFFDEFDKILERQNDVKEQQQAAYRLDDILNERIQLPVNQYVIVNEQVADRTNEANRQTAEKMFEAFLLLGVCGGVGGLVAGLAIARGLRRTMIKLDVSVQGAADKLREVVGPVTISTSGGISDIESGFKQVENHISLVIERLRLRELESLRNQKFAAVGQLAAGLAHELRNPLMPMKMLVQRALSRPDGPSLSQPQLKVMDEEIRRMEGLVHEFLDFAKPQALQRKRIELGHVIRQASELVAARASVQHVALCLHIPEEKVEVDADPLRIRQVMLNLFLNSLDVQPEGGKIDVFLECIQHPPPEFEDRRVSIRVVDSGSGIPAEIVDNIFEPFVSTKETGTGLGLSISHRIIGDHGGRLIFENLPAGGVQFQILLKLADVEKGLSDATATV